MILQYTYKLKLHKVLIIWFEVCKMVASMCVSCCASIKYSHIRHIYHWSNKAYKYNGFFLKSRKLHWKWMEFAIKIKMGGGSSLNQMLLIKIQFPKYMVLSLLIFHIYIFHIYIIYYAIFKYIHHATNIQTVECLKLKNKYILILYTLNKIAIIISM